MAGIGDLVANLTVNSAPFKAGLSAASSSLRSFSSLAKSALMGFGAAAAAAAGSVYVVTDRLGALAGVADLAAQTGMSGKWLQQMQFAADQTGVSADTLAGALKKMTMQVGAAAKGSSSAQAGFAQLGLNMQTLSAMSPEQQFEAVAAAISKLPDEASRAAAAVGIFGKSGIEMTGLLSAGMSDITELMAEAERLGIGMSDEDLARAGAADDSLQKIKMSMAAIMDRGAVLFAPLIEQAGNFIIRMGDIGGTVDTVIGAGLDFYNKFSDWLQDIGVVVGTVAGNMGNIWAGVFEDVPKYAQAALEWIQQNSHAIFANIATAAENMWNRVETKSRQLGEWIAYQAGWSDEMIDIEAAQAKPMQQLTAFQAPELSSASQGVLNDIAEELALSRQQRSGEVLDSMARKSPVLSQLSDPAAAADTAAATAEETSRSSSQAGAELALRGSTDAMRIIFNSRQDAAVKATNTLTNVVKNNVAKPLEKIASNTQPQFAPEFT